MRKLLLVVAIVYFGCNPDKHESEIKELLSQGEKADSVGDYKNAISSYTKILDLDSLNMSASYFRGRAYINTGEFEKGISDYSKVIVHAPDALVYSDRGYAYTDIHDYEKAHKDFVASIKLDKNFVQSYYGLSLVSVSLGDLNRAMKICMMADSLNYLEYYSLPLKAQIYIKSGRYQDAINAELKQIVKEKNSLSIGNHYSNVAFAENMLGKYDAALGHANLSMGLYPDNAYVYNNKSYALLKTGKVKEALPLVEKSLELLSDNAYAYNTRGQIYLAMNQKEKACDDFKNGISLAVDSILLVELNDLVKKHCTK